MFKGEGVSVPTVLPKKDIQMVGTHPFNLLRKKATKEAKGTIDNRVFSASFVTVSKDDVLCFYIQKEFLEGRKKRGKGAVTTMRTNTFEDCQGSCHSRGCLAIFWKIPVPKARA